MHAGSSCSASWLPLHACMLPSPMHHHPHACTQGAAHLARAHAPTEVQIERAGREVAGLLAKRPAPTATDGAQLQYVVARRVEGEMKQQAPGGLSVVAGRAAGGGGDEAGGRQQQQQQQQQQQRQSAESGTATVCPIGGRDSPPGVLQPLAAWGQERLEALAGTVSPAVQPPAAAVQQQEEERAPPSSHSLPEAAASPTAKPAAAKVEVAAAVGLRGPSLAHAAAAANRLARRPVARPLFQSSAASPASSSQHRNAAGFPSGEDSDGEGESEYWNQLYRQPSEVGGSQGEDWGAAGGDGGSGSDQEREQQECQADEEDKDDWWRQVKHHYHSGDSDQSCDAYTADSLTLRDASAKHHQQRHQHRQRQEEEAGWGGAAKGRRHSPDDGRVGDQGGPAADAPGAAAWRQLRGVVEHLASRIEETEAELDVER
jgi:hypothetical protein